VTRVQAALTCNAISSTISRYKKKLLTADNVYSIESLEHKIEQLTIARDELKGMV